MPAGGSSDFVTYCVDWAFQYVQNDSLLSLFSKLNELAARWPGWDKYPWHITRDIHQFANTPPANFHYVLFEHYASAQAAHLILNAEFEDRDEVFAMMIREEFQFKGVFRLLLVLAMDQEMSCSNMPYIQDCTGLDEGHKSVSNDELVERRGRYRECIERAERNLVRMLNMASQGDVMGESLLGCPLRVWAQGLHMPEPVKVKVREQRRRGKKYVRPHCIEAAEIVRTGRRVPRLVFEVDGAEKSAKKDDTQKKEARVPSDDEMNIVGAALALAEKLDAKPRLKAPTHLTVFRLYCVKELSVSQIAKKCGCSHGTVMNRKRSLETMLESSLESFCQQSGLLDSMSKAMEDGRARKIYRRGMVS